MRILLAAVGLLLTCAGGARAQTNAIVTPFVGSSGNLDACPVVQYCMRGGSEEDDDRTVFGVSGGVLWPFIGVEGDFGRSPGFFRETYRDGAAFIDGEVTTLMGNVLVSAPVGNVRPYGTVWAGLMRFAFEPAAGPPLSLSKIGLNYGGGVIVFVSDRIGGRGDLRQFRAQGEGTIVLTFWRLAGGVTLPW